MASRTYPSTALTHSGATPLYIQLHDIISEKISSGEWQPNTMIPSENKLSEYYGISRMTVRNVITQFVTEGMLTRIQGKGTFVSAPKYELTSLHYSGIRAQLEEMGHLVETRLISMRKKPADDYEARKLEIPAGSQIFVMKRVRSANGVDISYHETFIPAALCEGLEKKDLISEQLCKILSTDYQLNCSRSVETLESYAADASKAKYLDVPTGFPLLYLKNQLYTKEGLIYEYTRIFFRGDKVVIRFEHSGEQA